MIPNALDAHETGALTRDDLASRQSFQVILETVVPAALRPAPSPNGRRRFLVRLRRAGVRVWYFGREAFLLPEEVTRALVALMEGEHATRRRRRGA